MASKRTTGPDAVASSGSAPARAKSKVTRKHRSATAAEASDNAFPPSSMAQTTATLSADSSATYPTFEEIAQLAYSYWEARGYQGGSPEEDWLRAENELSLAKTAGVTA